MTEDRPRPRPRPTVASGTTDAGSDKAGSGTTEQRKPSLSKASPAKARLRRPSFGRASSGTRAVAGMRPGLAVLVTLAVVVVLFAVLNVVLMSKRDHNSDVDAARTAAVASAKKRVPAILSYDYKNLTSFRSTAPQNLTGSFKKQYVNLVSTIIAPGATSAQTVTKTLVKAIGVVSAKPHSVVLLVLLDQASTDKNNKTPQYTGSRVRVTLADSGGDWLISDVSNT